MLKLTGKTAYRLAIEGSLVATLMLIWLSLGVGIIGADGDPANQMYFVVVDIGIIGAIVTRMRPFGMTRVLLAMAFVQALITGIAMIAKLGLPYSGPLVLLLLNGFFVVTFVGAAWLFRRAAGGQQG
ncbi:MAG: hypothetical protein CVU41_12175 [Chloroflexi bacterium HGW-Chloroflexi-3]|nr:MAG: hypothetical protein CVU41_12175 [Chloroflexi bacterium HGW-Chloroflexi-3]